MDKVEYYDISVGSSIFAIFQDFKYPLERCFAEFIDNSLQSYLDHKEELNSIGVDKCYVKIIIDEDSIVIQDNSYGMDEEEFKRAIKLASLNPRKEEKNRLSVYGIGLKYASLALGSTYKIESSQYNENLKRSVVIDLSYLKENNPEKVEGRKEFEGSAKHYTIIRITNLRQRISTKKINQLREALGYIYENYISNEDLAIEFQYEKVSKPCFEFLRSPDDTPYREYFNGEFKTENLKEYKYEGRIGILNTGNQSIAGFKLIQANRCIHPYYKPEKIFGKGNDYRQQRIIGEVIFDSNLDIVTSDKQNIKLSEEDENRFINSLSENATIKEYLKLSKNFRKRKENKKVNDTLEKNLHGISRSSEKVSLIEENDAIDEKEENHEIAFTYDSNNSSIIEETFNNDTSIIEEEVKESENSYKEKNLEKYIYTKVVDKFDNSYNLYLKVGDEENNEKFIQLNKNEDGDFILDIFNKNKNFEKYFKNISDVSLFVNLLIESIIKAQAEGVKLSDSLKIIDIINKYFKDSYGN